MRRKQHRAMVFVQPGGLILWPTLREAYARGRPVPQKQHTCRLCPAPIRPRCANVPCRHFEEWQERVESGAGLYRLGLERMEESAYRTQRGDQSSPRL